jgi:NADPH:quinone reductase-like Zn-dependent oxidoreductase
MLDVAGTRSWAECARVLEPQATLVIVGAPKGGRLLGPLSHVAKLRLASSRSSAKAVFFVAKLTRADLEVLAEMLTAGTVTPVVDRRYALNEVADAFEYLGEGHARAKIVVDF